MYIILAISCKYWFVVLVGKLWNYICLVNVGTTFLFEGKCVIGLLSCGK